MKLLLSRSACRAGTDRLALFAHSQARHSTAVQTGRMTQDQPVPDADGSPSTASTPAPAAPAPPASGIRWQDRVLRLPSVIAVALATLIMGGFAGVGVSAWVRHDERVQLRQGFSDRMRDHMRDHMRDGDGWGRGPMGGGPGGPGGWGGGPGGWGPGDGQDGSPQAPSEPPQQNG